MLAAMEIYNKPNFSYREECFSILAINAWELLLKARILQLSRNRISAILQYERRPRADGTLSERACRKKNRSGAHASIGLFKAFDLLVNEYGDRPAQAIRNNLELLVEVRDNAVHFLNKGFELERRIQELGAACLKNYLNAVRQWFGVDMSAYNFFLMPLSFFRDVGPMEAITLNTDEKKLLQYFVSSLDGVDDDPTADFNLALRLDIRLVKTSHKEAPSVVMSNQPGAIPVLLEEADIRQRYPLEYSHLTAQLKRRYTDFKLTEKFYEIKKQLEKNKKFCNVRLLDPGNPKSAKKKFYNANIFNEFDKYYTKKRP